MHLHVHLIYRFTGDIPDSKGGVRVVIPIKKIINKHLKNKLKQLKASIGFVIIKKNGW